VYTQLAGIEVGLACSMANRVDRGAQQNGSRKNRKEEFVLLYFSSPWMSFLELAPARGEGKRVDGEWGNGTNYGRWSSVLVQLQGGGENITIQNCSMGLRVAHLQSNWKMMGRLRRST
jgi:hypothetical protein